MIASTVDLLFFSMAASLCSIFANLSMMIASRPFLALVSCPSLSSSSLGDARGPLFNLSSLAFRSATKRPACSGMLFFWEIGSRGPGLTVGNGQKHRPFLLPLHFRPLHRGRGVGHDLFDSRLEFLFGIGHQSSALLP